MKFELYQDSKKEWRWRLKSKNGRIVAESGESYKQKAGALNGIKCVRKSGAKTVLIKEI